MELDLCSKLLEAHKTEVLNLGKDMIVSPRIHLYVCQRFVASCRRMMLVKCELFSDFRAAGGQPLSLVDL